jgi:hypothetical protein
VVTQLLRQGDAKAFKKYSQDETADETRGAPEAEPESERGAFGFCHGKVELMGFVTVKTIFARLGPYRKYRSDLESRELHLSGRSAAW